MPNKKNLEEIYSIIIEEHHYIIAEYRRVIEILLTILLNTGDISPEMEEQLHNIMHSPPN